jgi:predicted CopG family antitoxin
MSDSIFNYYEILSSEDKKIVDEFLNKLINKKKKNIDYINIAISQKIESLLVLNHSLI